MFVLQFFTRESQVRRIFVSLPISEWVKNLCLEYRHNTLHASVAGIRMCTPIFRVVLSEESESMTLKQATMKHRHLVLLYDQLLCFLVTSVLLSHPHFTAFKDHFLTFS